MAHNYLVTAHPPTAVTACATGKNLHCRHLIVDCNIKN